MSVNATDPMIGRLIDGRYQVRSRIARGGMATVYLATDLRLERRVAVKVMHGHLADDSQFKQRFIQEARSAARLAHPNVVNVFDQGQDSDSAYLVMEYLPGITLRELLEEYHQLTPQQTIDITEAVLSGLGAAHKAGIVHRDLKPENVLLADDGRIKIGDFGLARAASANTATGAALLGTIAYLSPELVTRGIADTRSDIYAVGIMMYEMLTGVQPFTGDQPMQIAYRHANEPVPPPSARNPKVPRELDELVSWATAKDPDQRPADARALLEQLRDTEAVLDLPTTPPLTARATRVLPAARPPRDGARSNTGPAQPGTGPAQPDTGPAGFEAPDRPGADAETQVLGATRAGSDLALVDPAAPARRRRRWIPIVAVLAVLALLGGGLGWWFGLGPGSRVTVPESVKGATVEDARAILEDLGFDVAEETRTASDPVVPQGAVANTDPAIGESLERGAAITILVSSGPELFPIAFTVGMPQESAEALVAEHWTLDGVEQRFHPEVETGTLIDAIGAGDSSLLGVPEYGELQPIRLIISAGPVPAVRDLSVDEARAALAAVDLTVVDANVQENYDDEIAAGRVIGLVDTGTLSPGDEVALNVSRGPAPVDVPAIIDLTWTEAKAALDAAGLRYEFDRGIDQGLAANFPDDARVTSASPAPGTTVLRGDTVVVRLGI